MPIFRICVFSPFPKQQRLGGGWCGEECLQPADPTRQAEPQGWFSLHLSLGSRGSRAGGEGGLGASCCIRDLSVVRAEVVVGVCRYSRLDSDSCDNLVTPGKTDVSVGRIHNRRLTSFFCLLYLPLIFTHTHTHTHSLTST